MPAHIVVIGAGVVGLSTAIRLQETGYIVSIVARDLPSDPKSIRYTSPWAGAHHVSVVTGPDLRMHEFDKATFGVMAAEIRADPSVPMIFAPQTEYREGPRPEGDTDQISLLGRYHPDFRRLEPSELPEGIQHGAKFTCILIDTPHYLPWLVKRFEGNGGQIHRATLAALGAALSVSPQLASASAIVNCTGLGAIDLIGDKDVFPTRGQLVIVRAPWVKEGRTRLGPGVYTYTIPRKSGHVVIGGSADANDWNPTPRPELTDQIKRRGIALHPELLPADKRAAGRIEDLDVVELAVGLRPTRKGGVRIEADEIDIDGRKVPVVHNYGHGGFGYQSSWGTASTATALVRQVLGGSSATETHGGASARSKL